MVRKSKTKQRQKQKQSQKVIVNVGTGGRGGRGGRGGGRGPAKKPPPKQLPGPVSVNIGPRSDPFIPREYKPPTLTDLLSSLQSVKTPVPQSIEKPPPTEEPFRKENRTISSAVEQAGGPFVPFLKESTRDPSLFTDVGKALVPNTVKEFFGFGTEPNPKALTPIIPPIQAPSATLERAPPTPANPFITTAPPLTVIADLEARRRNLPLPPYAPPLVSPFPVETQTFVPPTPGQPVPFIPEPAKPTFEITQSKILIPETTTLVSPSEDVFYDTEDVFVEEEPIAVEGFVDENYVPSVELDVGPLPPTREQGAFSLVTPTPAPPPPPAPAQLPTPPPAPLFSSSDVTRLPIDAFAEQPKPFVFPESRSTRELESLFPPFFDDESVRIFLKKPLYELSDIAEAGGLPNAQSYRDKDELLADMLTFEGGTKEDALRQITRLKQEALAKSERDAKLKLGSLQSELASALSRRQVEAPFVFPPPPPTPTIFGTERPEFVPPSFPEQQTESPLLFEQRDVTTQPFVPPPFPEQQTEYRLLTEQPDVTTQPLTLTAPLPNPFRASLLPEAEDEFPPTAPNTQPEFIEEGAPTPRQFEPRTEQLVTDTDLAINKKTDRGFLGRTPPPSPPRTPEAERSGIPVIRDDYFKTPSSLASGGGGEAPQGRIDFKQFGSASWERRVEKKRREGDPEFVGKSDQELLVIADRLRLEGKQKSSEKGKETQAIRREGIRIAEEEARARSSAVSGATFKPEQLAKPRQSVGGSGKKAVTGSFFGP